MAKSTKRCLRCHKEIKDRELHKIVIYVVQEKFTENHYEHVECPVINNHFKFTKFSCAFLTLKNFKIKKKEEVYSSTMNKPIIPASA